MKDIKQTTENIRKENNSTAGSQPEKLDIIGLDQQFVGVQSIRPARSVIPKSIKPDHYSSNTSKSVGRKF